MELEAMWYFGIVVGWCIFGVVHLLALLVQLSWNCWQYVDDEDLTVFSKFVWFVKLGNSYRVKLGNSYRDETDLEEFYCTFILSVLIFGLASLGWFIVTPMFAIYGTLYGLRHMNRFKKKVNNALGDNHPHD